MVRLTRMRAHTPRLLVLALIVAPVVVLLLGEYPHDSVAGKHPTTMEKIVATPSMVIAARLVAMYVVVFVLASIIARLWNGEWLRKAGPFEVADQVQTLKDEIERLQSQARDAEARVETVTQALRVSDTAMQRVSTELQQAPRRGFGWPGRGKR